MVELDTIMRTLREALRGERDDNKRGMRVPIRDLRVMLAALERAERDREYLREKNDIIRAYAGPTGMTPEDVAAALGRIPELERKNARLIGEMDENIHMAQRAAREEIGRLRKALREHHPITGCGCGAGDINASTALAREDGDGS